MEMYIIDRQAAFNLLGEYIKAENLIRHALAVEAVMRHFAALTGEDPERWGVVGLLHDVDYEKYPDRHCEMVRGILTEKAIPKNISAQLKATDISL